MVKGNMEHRRKALKERFPFWERLTLSQRFDKLAEEFAENEFIATEEQHYTYREAKHHIDELAKGLIQLGIKPREHVAVALGNYPEFVFLTFALAKIGAIKISVNYRLCTQELNYVLKHSDAVCLLTMPRNPKQGMRQMVQKLCPELLEDKTSPVFPRLRKVVVFGEKEFQGTRSVISFTKMKKKASLVSEQELEERQAQTGYPDEITDIFYTSGTTGKPKGAMLSHDMLWRSAYGSCINRAFEIGRRIFIPIPFFHVYGYVEGILAASLVGGTVIPQLKFDAEKALRLMEKEKANDILCVPAIAINLLNCPNLREFDLSALRAVYCSAAPTPLWVWERIRKDLGVKEINTGYGMTEVCGASAQNDPLDSPEVLAARVGKILPGGSSGLPEYGFRHTQYKTVHPETGQDLSPGQEGELVCRGNIVTKGYYNEPLVTEKAINKDGWLKTGDLGRIDENGYIELTGRCKDMYKVGGENVSPQRIERTIEECEKVAQAAVVGIPDVKMGEIGVAFIQIKKNQKCTEEEIRCYCEPKLSKFELPKHYIFIEEKDWPLTPTKKIQKTKLKDKAVQDLNRK
jgi:fatty-acyl-CoA synthase